MTHPHLPFPRLMEEGLIFGRERRFLLLQGPYALGVGETDGLRFGARILHDDYFARNSSLVNISVSLP